MAAAVSDPGGPRDLSPLTTTDVENIQWRLSTSDADVGGLKASSMMPRGGTCSVVDFDRMTDRQRRNARRCMRIDEIIALVPLHHWQVLRAYHAPLVARVRDDLAKSGAGARGAEHSMRLSGILPLTPSAEKRGRELVDDQRAGDRRRRAAQSPLKLVGGTDVDMTVRGPERHAHDGVTPRQWFGKKTEADALFLISSVEESRRQRVQGPVGNGELSPEHVRDGALRALAGAREGALSREAMNEAQQMYALASDAFVQARRAVRGKDGEEKRQEKADRWVNENACRTMREEVSDFFGALGISSRVQSS